MQSLQAAKNTTASWLLRLGLFSVIVLLSGCAHEPEPPVDAPRIKLVPEEIYLGKVEEGVELTRAFKVSNSGTKPLEILDVYATCGCTVPRVSAKKLAPGEEISLEVTVDTSMKQDRVTKTVNISSNDPAHKIVSLALTMDVTNRHKGLSNEGKAKILTDEKCTSCHVSGGVGLFGKDLFQADCAMCHGADGEGGAQAIGPCLIAGDYSNAAYRQFMWNVTANGSKRHRSMPGFLVDAGGPLSKEQVDSLIDYLARSSKSTRKN